MPNLHNLPLILSILQKGRTSTRLSEHGDVIETQNNNLSKLGSWQRSLINLP